MKNDKILNKKLSKSKNPTILITNAMQAFTQLKQGFTKAPILSHFDLDGHIRIEIDTFSYAIGDVLTQLTLDSGQWNPIVYLSQKMILAET